ncbi:hypothetical protein B0H16DRAFT_1539040, partial [Mycena metata]
MSCRPVAAAMNLLAARRTSSTAVLVQWFSRRRTDHFSTEVVEGSIPWGHFGLSGDAGASNLNSEFITGGKTASGYVAVSGPLFCFQHMFKEEIAAFVYVPDFAFCPHSTQN